MKVKTYQKYINSKLVERKEPWAIEYINKVEDIAFCCNNLSKLYHEGVLDVRFGKTKDQMDMILDDHHTPFVCIIKSFTEDIGDYSFDGEDETYIPNFLEEESLYGIKICPFCGSKIEVENKVEDYTERLNEKLRILPKNKKSNKAKEIFNEINKMLEQKIF